MKTDQINQTCASLGLKMCDVRHWQLTQQINYLFQLEPLNSIWQKEVVIRQGDTIRWMGREMIVDECFAHVTGFYDVGALYVYCEGELLPAEGVEKLKT